MTGWLRGVLVEICLAAALFAIAVVIAVLVDLPHVALLVRP